MSLDFLAGCVGGCAGVLVGHPLDTIKVHLQTQDPRNPKYNGIIHCMKTIVAAEGAWGLYKGISSPMAGIGLVNAIVFGVYGNVQRHTEDPDSLYSHFLAGSVAGLIQSLVCAPMELAKTRIQLQHDTGQGVKLKGPYDCIKHVFRTEGIRGTFKGLGITALRDIPGFASYFVSYEYMMRKSKNPSGLYTMLCGGFAGIFSWLACYPMDVIKTCLQADGMSAAPQYKGMVDCAMQGYRKDGIHFFSRGLFSTLVRAFPMNAACFFVVSVIMKLTKVSNIDFVVQSAEPLPLKIVKGESESESSSSIVHVSQREEVNKELSRKRFFMTRSLQALGAFNEAVCHTEAAQLAKELYPEEENYHFFDHNHSNLKCKVPVER